MSELLHFVPRDDPTQKNSSIINFIDPYICEALRRNSEEGSHAQIKRKTINQLKKAQDKPYLSRLVEANFVYLLKTASLYEELRMVSLEAEDVQEAIVRHATQPTSIADLQVKLRAEDIESPDKLVEINAYWLSQAGEIKINQDYYLAATDNNPHQMLLPGFEISIQSA